MELNGDDVFTAGRSRGRKNPVTIDTPALSASDRITRKPACVVRSVASFPVSLLLSRFSPGTASLETENSPRKQPQLT